MREKVSLQNEKNKKRALNGLSETSHQLLQVFGENEIISEFGKCGKISKQKKNASYVQEYKKIIGTIEAEVVTEKYKMREKF